MLASTRHPVLRLDVLSGDGTFSSSYRTFCSRRGGSVLLEQCSACVHCTGIGVDVECTVPVIDRPDPLGESTPVGAVVSSGTFAVDGSATVRSARHLMRAKGRAVLGVVGDDHAIIGLVHDHPVHAADENSVVMSMSAPITIPERTPLRAALRVLAAAHLREAPVITSTGELLGLFRDVEGLRWLFQARSVHPTRAMTEPRTVRDIMNPTLLYVREGDRMTLVRSRILQFGVTGVPVLDDLHRPVGFVSLRDIPVGCDDEIRVTAPVLTVHETEPVAQAARRLAESERHRMVVVDGSGIAVGMVSAVDFLRAMTGATSRHPARFETT